MGKGAIILDWILGCGIRIKSIKHGNDGKGVDATRSNLSLSSLRKVRHSSLSQQCSTLRRRSRKSRVQTPETRPKRARQKSRHKLLWRSWSSARRHRHCDLSERRSAARRHWRKSRQVSHEWRCSGARQNPWQSLLRLGLKHLLQ